ncbi:hypothetical protein SGRIM128S_08406 [Streptomyces griseomycini]
MPLFAVFEHMPEVNLVSGFYQSEVVTKAIHGTLHARATRPAPTTPMLAHVRGRWSSCLVRAEHWAEAMSQLIRVDGHVGALPWTLSAEPPTAEFAVYRALAVTRLRGERRQSGYPCRTEPTGHGRRAAAGQPADRAGCAA